MSDNRVTISKDDEFINVLIVSLNGDQLGKIVSLSKVWRFTWSGNNWSGLKPEQLEAIYALVRPKLLTLNLTERLKR
jgi:hypothetical protein